MDLIRAAYKLEYEIAPIFDNAYRPARTGRNQAFHLCYESTTLFPNNISTIFTSTAKMRLKVE